MIRIFFSSFITTVGIVASSGLHAEVTPVTGKPNIVLILADDLGFGDVGCYNPPIQSADTAHRPFGA